VGKRLSGLTAFDALLGDQHQMFATPSCVKLIFQI
jgi:hypothetical protein